MKNLTITLLCLLVIITLYNCGSTQEQTLKTKASAKTFSKIEIETLVEKNDLNVRAIEVFKNVGLAYLTSMGEFGMLFNEEANVLPGVKKQFPINIKHDTIVPNFRALALTSNRAFGVSIGSPGLIFNLDNDAHRNKVVYQENHEKAFYDAIEFWNDEEGIAMGDPTDNCISIVITRDRGKNWTKVPCNILPEVIEGEAAFAASDTNIAIVGDKTWIATGGKASRILFSPDKGKTWEVFNTPITQGIETAGMYSLDFYDENNGFAIGGDYTKPGDSTANKIRTNDGGKTWELVAENENPGYRSCVQYVPNSNAKALVAVGFKGIDYSSDAGESWTHLSDEGFYTIRFVNDSIAYVAGNKRIAKLLFR